MRKKNVRVPKARMPTVRMGMSPRMNWIYAAARVRRTYGIEGVWAHRIV